ncbi:hypothetical protein [Bacillus sp. Cs-700]|uniref:hypothetical protein n=1 Tax=Bacillus sp. Cs-700 TaxID=2589818 RepID=UPI00140BABAB|nr:hypothetical protein [Bacillus sp. Cs-700]
MVISWIKWKLMIRWKVQWNYITFFKKIPGGKWFWIAALLLSIVNFFMILFGTYFLLKATVFNQYFLDNTSSNSILLTTLSQAISYLNTHIEVLWSLLFFIIFLFSVLSGISSSKWQLHSMDHEWLEIHAKVKSQTARLFLYLEAIVWDVKDYVFSYVPIIIALSLLTDMNMFGVVGIVILTLFLFISIGLVTSVLHYHYLSSQRTRLHFYFRLFFNLLIRMVIVALAFFGGKILTPWIKSFPLTSNDVDVAKYNDWLSQGAEVVKDLLTPLTVIFKYPIFPHNFLASLLFDEVRIFDGVMLLSGCIVLFAFMFTITQLKSKNRSENFYPFTIIEKLIPSKIFGKSNYTRMQVKHLLRGDYFLYRFPVLTGSFLFWFQLGLMVSFMTGLNPGEKIYYFILSFYLFFFVYFHIASIYSELTGFFSVDSEGKNVIIHLLAGKTVWEVFKYKYLLFIIYTYPLLIVADITLILFSRIKLVEAAVIVVIHCFSFLFLSALLFLPSIISPHFNYINIEQLEDYPDQNSIQGIVRYLIVGVFIPACMIPTAFYLTDYINLSTLLAIQWGEAILLFFSLIFFMLFARNKLRKLSKIEQLSL